MEQIYFSDNFFLLRNRLQVLQELLELEVNASIFNTQIMAEVRNIAGLLEEHERLLNQRNQLQGYAELSHQLFRVKRAFLLFLGSAIYSQRDFLQQLLRENGDEWHKIIVKISDGNEKLAQEFRNYKQEFDDNSTIVSDAELQLLFQKDQELDLGED